MEDYNPDAPPGTDESRVTVVQFQLEIMGIREVNPSENFVIFKACVRNWYWDPRLMWDPSKFGGVEKTYFKLDTDVGTRLWYPDTAIEEDAGDDTLSNFKWTDASVNYTGHVYTSRFGDLKVSFNFYVKHYPWDEHRVNITFEPWTYTDDRLILVPSRKPFYS